MFTIFHKWILSLYSFNEIPASVGREEERGANLKKEEKRRRASPPRKPFPPFILVCEAVLTNLSCAPLRLPPTSTQKKTEGNPKFTKSLPTAHVLKRNTVSEKEEENQPGIYFNFFVIWRFLFKWKPPINPLTPCSKMKREEVKNPPPVFIPLCVPDLMRS